MHKTRFIVQRAISLTGALLMCTQVYTKLNERLGLKDHATVLNAMVAKMAINLKVYGDCDDIIHATLNLFQVADWLGYDASLPSETQPMYQLQSFQTVQCQQAYVIQCMYVWRSPAIICQRDCIA